jgi:hypothetical protein
VVSRATVRAAIAAYLNAAAPAIPGLQHIYQAKPWWVDGATGFRLSANGGSGAFAYLHLVASEETRWSVPWNGGDIGVHYDFHLVVVYIYEIPSTSQATAVSEDAWVGPVDTILQGIKDAIHADPTLGTTSTKVIFNAGQTPNPLKTSSEQPLKSSGRLYSWHVIEFRVTEVIQA